MSTKSPTPSSEVQDLIDQFVVNIRGHRKADTPEIAKIKVMSWLNSLKSPELPARKRKNLRQNIRRVLTKYPWMIKQVSQGVSL